MLIIKFTSELSVWSDSSRMSSSQLSASNISVRLSKRTLPQTATLFSHPPALPTEVMAMVVPMRDKAQCKHKRKRVKLLQKVLWSSQCSRSKDHWAIEANLIQGTSEKTHKIPWFDPGHHILLFLESRTCELKLTFFLIWLCFKHSQRKP